MKGSTAIQRGHVDFEKTGHYRKLIKVRYNTKKKWWIFFFTTCCDSCKKKKYEMMYSALAAWRKQFCWFILSVYIFNFPFSWWMIWYTLTTICFPVGRQFVFQLSLWCNLMQGSALCLCDYPLLCCSEKEGNYGV